MSDELKPCAHCGESAELCCPSGLSWWVQCSNKSCGMATKIAYSPEPVAAAWNRRADAALAKREAVPANSEPATEDAPAYVTLSEYAAERALNTLVALSEENKEAGAVVCPIVADLRIALCRPWKPAEREAVAVVPTGIWMREFVDAVEREAFNMRAPNTHTPVLVGMCIEAKRRLLAASQQAREKGK